MLKQKLSIAEDRKLVFRAASDAWASLACPRSLTCEILLRNGEFDQLVALECDPAAYPTIDAFRRAYWATSLVRKYELVPTSIDRKAVALAKFLESEERCRETNLRLLSGEITQQGAINRVFRRMVENISKLLGEVSKDTYLEVLYSSRWGNGSTSSCHGSYVTLHHKAAAEPQCTSELGPTIAAAAYRSAGFLERPEEDFRVIRGSRLDFVPKDAKTDRCICIEPHVNAFLQRGAGIVLRKRLLRWGLHLQSQPDRQRDMARRAYTERLATIDLASASDCVSVELVRALLPESWWLLLERLRSWETQLPDGRFIRLEKHSSMGNGYTFELETLIFASAVRAVMAELKRSGPWGVFGDDIILPADCASLLIEVLAFIGFKTNQSKTFTTGNFFESCGSDYFQGVPVRPFFFKEGQTLPKHLQFCQFLDKNWPTSDGYSLSERHQKRLPRGWRDTYGPPAAIAGPWRGTPSFRWDNLKGWVRPASVVTWVPSSYCPEDSAASAFAALFTLSQFTADEWGTFPAYERIAVARRRGKWVRVRQLWVDD